METVTGGEERVPRRGEDLFGISDQRGDNTTKYEVMK